MTQILQCIILKFFSIQKSAEILSHTDTLLSSHPPQVRQVVCCVLDEAHHASAQHPYAVVLTHFIHATPPGAPTRFHESDQGWLVGWFACWLVWLV